MLKGRNILARHYREDALPAESPMDPDYMQDPFLAASASNFPSGDHISSITGLPLTISSPKTAQLYNIFHPSDPIAYRLEPLISPAMSTMKPQALPYTKKTISASVSGIGATIGQSVSGLWSSLSSGIASSILNRSLGLTSDDVARMESAPSPNRQASLSVGAGTNISGGVIPPDTSIPPLQRENTNEKKNKLAENTAAADRDGKGAPTLIDDEIETLYAGFQKRRKSHQKDVGDGNRDLEWVEAEERGKKLRREEAKVRALNGNGRVDYAIQEYVPFLNCQFGSLHTDTLTIDLFWISTQLSKLFSTLLPRVTNLTTQSTIASHLSYWADEDVSHFIMSQLLSRHRVTTRAHSKSDTNLNPSFNSNRMPRNNLK